MTLRFLESSGLHFVHRQFGAKLLTEEEAVALRGAGRGGRKDGRRAVPARERPLFTLLEPCKSLVENDPIQGLGVEGRGLGKLELR